MSRSSSSLWVAFDSAFRSTEPQPWPLLEHFDLHTGAHKPWQLSMYVHIYVYICIHTYVQYVRTHTWHRSTYVSQESRILQQACRAWYPPIAQQQAIGICKRLADQSPCTHRERKCTVICSFNAKINSPNAVQQYSEGVPEDGGEPEVEQHGFRFKWESRASLYKLQLFRQDVWMLLNANQQNLPAYVGVRSPAFDYNM